MLWSFWGERIVSRCLWFNFAEQNNIRLQAKFSVKKVCIQNGGYVSVICRPIKACISYGIYIYTYI